MFVLRFLLLSLPTLLLPLQAELLPFAEFPGYSLQNLRPPDGQASWYVVEYGFVEHESPPPNLEMQAGTAFGVNSLPKSMRDATDMQQFRSIFGVPHRIDNLSEISYDPLGRRLYQSFHLGRSFYFVLKNDQPNALNFAFYYYQATNVSWQPKNTPEPLDYEVDDYQFGQEFTIPAGKWLIIYAGERRQTVLERNEQSVRSRYRYFVVRITRA